MRCSRWHSRCSAKAGCAIPGAACATLAAAAGAPGMAGGQAIDLASSGTALSLAELQTMHRMKTGALIRAAVAAGRCLRAPARRRRRSSALDSLCTTRPGWPSRSSTTCSTSRAPMPRWARPRARMPRNRSRRTCRCWDSPQARRHAEALRAEACAALAPFRRRVPPAGRACRLDRVAQPLTPMPMYPLLERINQPADLRALDRGELRDLCAGAARVPARDGQRRRAGICRRTLARSNSPWRCTTSFNTPADRIVWDVGHQTYVHKILTGRREAMAKLRQAGGPSGFPRRIGKRIRHVRHRAFVDVDLRRAGHGDRSPDARARTGAPSRSSATAR